MTGEVIKSFLVGLGFEVDDSSLSKFNKAIATATVRVTALYTSVQLAASGIVAGIADISDGFEKMGYEYRLIVPAINKAILLRQELLKAYSAAGINIYKVIQQSVKLNFSLTKTKFALEAIYKSVGSRFFDLLTKQSDLFRQKIYQNMPKIQAALEGFVKIIFKALQVTTELGARAWSILSRVYDFFLKLDEATSGWSTFILGVVAAWKILNLEFLATPLGMILVAGVALLGLYDDFKTFQEGGKSLFNWSAFIPVINSVADALESLKNVWLQIVDIAGNLILAICQLAKGDYSGAFDSLIESAKKAFGILGPLADLVLKIWALSGQAGKFIDDKLLGGILGNGPAPLATSTPLGVGGNKASTTNQNVNQQTNINITGSANANATGAAVAGQQQRVNQDMVRNFRPAVQ